MGADDLPEPAEQRLIPESDTAGMLKLLSTVAAMEGAISAKRQALMKGLAELIGADAWGWIIARAEDRSDTPAPGLFLTGGMNDAQVTRYAQIMEDRDYPPVEYAALNNLRRQYTHFTRGWDDLVTPEQWYGPQNRHVLD